MRVDLRWPPDEAAPLASVSVVSDLRKSSLVNVPLATLRTMQDHRYRIEVVQLASFESELRLKLGKLYLGHWGGSGNGIQWVGIAPLVDAK